MNCLKRIIIGTVLSPLFAWAVHAQPLQIEITRGVEAASPIAIVPFAWRGDGPPPETVISSIVSNDLARCGRFRPLSQSDIVEKPSEEAEVNFATWRLLKANHLAIGRVLPDPEGYAVEFELYDVFTQQRLLGARVQAHYGELRQVAHHISDLIFEKILGIKGAFSTRIAYVTVEGEKAARKYSLVVADADGYGPQNIVTSSEPLLSPSWSPDGNYLAYVSFEKGNSEIWIQEVGTGSRRKISANKGINGAPAWSPDGRQMAVTLSKDGNPEIYIMDVATGVLRRITNHWAIDTEAAWEPDGRHLIFTSDRGGLPQIYEVSAAGGEPKRITFDGKENARASISPDGTMLTMVHRSTTIYKVAVMDRSSGVLTVLSDGPLDESPSFAPNGSMILFATQEAHQGVLSAVSIDGGVRQRLVLTKGDVREPAWSPY